MEIKPPIYKKLKSKGRIFLPWYPIQEYDIQDCFEKSNNKSELLKQVTTWKTFHNYELFYAPNLLLSSFSKEIVDLAKKNITKKPVFYTSNGNSNLYNEDISYPSLERINFLIENKLDYFTVIDKMSCELKEDFGVVIDNFQFTSNVTMNLFQEFIKNETKFTVSLLFYVSKSELDDVVYVYDSEERELIQNNRDESYLIVGKFENYDLFNSSLYRFIQKKLELLFV
ncbi:hypothetical protein TVAG_410670 [Trichomonas vaginalis G3]|uniref:Uncharacterized protein n=2 Tax=Trichomonas vaginalis (strain ATCC PRA-98 / G3) TaxID=412133 RepID=A2FU56_TRIV3|nr:hypothetical protein TVAG_410670 [Trichomonas vaginalis G3]|eukprot:XP_001304484.1 hypothetical protein [Trichomonas vaginalis G3]